MSSSAPTGLTPTGKLRAGINFANTLLARKDAQGEATGIAVELASELARRLSAPLEIVGFDSGGSLAAAANNGAWDVAFLAVDPDRAGEIAFTSTYLEIDSTYLVPAQSPIQRVEDVDRLGIRISVSGKSAYDLFLARNVKRATLVRASGPAASERLFFSERLEVLAGLRPVLMKVAREHPETRVLEGRFTAVQQAVGVPRDSVAAASYVSEFIEDVKARGLVAEVVRKSGILGLSVLK